MPSVPYDNKCSMLGCKNPRSKMNSLCMDHGGLNFLQRTSDKQYKTSGWQQIRDIQLSKQPLCQSCLIKGKVKSATTVDHVFPWRQIGSWAFTHNIFQSLCTECHSYKTAQEQKGRFEHYKDKVEVYSKADFFYEK